MLFYILHLTKNEDNLILAITSIDLYYRERRSYITVTFTKNSLIIMIMMKEF